LKIHLLSPVFFSLSHIKPYSTLVQDYTTAVNPYAKIFGMVFLEQAKNIYIITNQIVPSAQSVSKRTIKIYNARQLAGPVSNFWKPCLTIKNESII
jgi:hypothetical protein